ncbi:hypothetical protein KKH18_02160 [bacterium]|nr:hypothetical protein [bacterium]
MLRCSRTTLFILVAFWAAGLSSAQDVFRLRTQEEVFTASSVRDTMFVLPVTWVEFDSIQVFRNHTRIAEYTHWRLMEPGNRIWIYTPLGPKDTLLIDYSYRSIPLYRTYARRSLRSLTNEPARLDTTRLVAALRPTHVSTEGWTRLNKSGSLIRSVQIGTGQDLELESALNLQIEGRIGKDIDVVAALTDQSTPIQPEGTTESINELEKVFVSIRSPHLAATLGDYTLELDGGRYDSYKRKLTGVMGEASYTDFQMVASGAVSDGEFTTNSFAGIEAVQGPYSLMGRNGEIGIVVLAGTEKVWLDGLLMRRGEGNDYTIDYASGEISFTPNRIISSDSRIVVDFEYANEDYERTYTAARIIAGAEDSRARVSASWIGESDDYNRPLGVALTEEDKESLRQAGDNPSLAVTFAGDSVGPKLGDYSRVDTLFEGISYSIFARMPRDSNDAPTGEWNLVFDEFGAGKGDYEATADNRGRTYFRWVGPGLGRYLPYKRIPLPEQQALADLRVEAKPVSGLAIGVEAASSRHNSNLLSQQDDADDDGYALAGHLEYDKLNPFLLGIRPYRLNFRNDIRYRNRDFSEITRSDEIEFDRDWDAIRSLNANETIIESKADVSPVRSLTVSGGIGLLDRETIQSSERYTGSIRFNPSERLSAFVSHLQLFSEDSTSGRKGDWIRQQGEVRGSRGRFSPRISLARERKRDETNSVFSGFRYLDYRTGMGIALPSHLGFDGEYGQRIDERLITETAYVDSATASTIAAEAYWRPPSIGWSKLRFVHREKDYAFNDTADVETDVGRLEALITPRSRVFEMNLTYEVAKSRTQDQVLLAIEVEPGTGTHRRGGEDEPSYVPDDQGDIILVSRNTGTFEPATELEFASLIWLRPDELNDESLSPLLRRLSTETEVTIEERSRLPLSARLLLLDQSQYRGDSTISGRITIRQDLHFDRLNRQLALRLRYRQFQSVENQILNGGQSRNRHEGSARIRAAYFSNLRGETETGLSRETISNISGLIPERDIDQWFIEQNSTLTLSRKWEIGLGLKASDTRDEQTRTQASLRELRPRGALSFSGKGRFDADVSWIRATSNKALIPFELGQGSNRGENYRWTLRGTYQLAQNFSGSLNYTGRRDAGEKTTHIGRVEVRAVF